MLKSELEYMLEDQGLRIKTEKGDYRYIWSNKFRPADLPIFMSGTKKIQNY